MARDILKEYGIGHFQSASGSLPTHKMCNWKMIGNNFEHFQYFKNCTDMKKFLKKQSDAIQDSPPEIIVHDQRNSWHDHTTWVDTYTKKSPWEMDELDYYYGSEYRATTNSFPTPKEFYSNEMTKFVNWFHPDPKKFFVSGSDKNAQKLRLFNAFMATRKRFENFLKVAPPDPSNTFVRHLVEMNVNDADDRDKVEDILLHFHHLGLHLPGFWTLYKTPSGKVVVYNPRLDHYMGYIKGHMFPKLCLYDKAQFDYVNCATYHILWKMERQPQSAKPQIRPGPQSKAQMPSFTEHSGHHVGQSRAEKEMLTRGAMVVGRMKHFAILPFTIEFGQPTTPFMETNVRFDDIGNFRVERYPVSIDMDAIELIPQKSTTPSLASSRNPRPKNSYRSNVVFETVDKKLIAAYTQAGITFQMGCVHRLEVLPRDAPVDIRSTTQERHTTFLTTDGYFLKYPSSVAVNNASAQIEPDLWYCDIPNMIASEPPADASLVREFRRTSMNPSAQRSQPEFSDGNFGNDKPGNYEQTRPDKADAPVRARVYRVVNPGPAGTRQMKNMVYAGGQRLVPAKAVNGNGTYRTIVRNYVPVQRVVQPTQRAPPVEYNTMMLSTNGSGQPKRQYIASRQGSQQAGPSRQAHAAVIAAQQRVIPLPSNGRNHPQGRLPSPPQVPQEKPVPKVGNECALMADLFYQQVAKEVVINEDGVQIEEHDMPLLDLEQSIDALDNSFDQQEPTTSQCFTEEHSYCKPVKARSQTSQTVPASLHRQKQQSDVREIGISGLGNDMGANTNQLNVAGPSKIEHNKRIKKKEAPVIENRPHLNKPTRTRYNGVAASMKELPPLTKPRHPDGPKPVNVSTTTLAAHIPEAKEMIAAQTKRRPGRPKLTTTSRGVEGKKNKEVIIAVLQTHQPEVVPPNLKLPEDRLGDLVQKQKETLDKIFRSSETKPAKRRKAKSRLTTAPRKSKGRRRQYVKQDVKMQKEMDLAVVGCVLDLLNHFGDIPDPEFDPRAIPLSRKSINIKKGMRPYMERRRLLWRLRCDGPVDSLTAPKTKAAKSSTRESSVYTAPGFLESLLNLTERQMTKKGYDRTIVECLDELVNQLDVVTEDLQQEKREIDVITLEDQVPLSATLHEDQMEIEEPATENVVTEMEEDADISPYEPHDHFDDVNLYIPAPEVSSTDKDDQDALAEIIHEVKTVVKDVIDKVTIAAELAVIPAPVDLAPKCPVEVKTAAMKDVIQWEVPEAVHFEEFVAVDNYEIDRIFTQDITAEPSIEPVPLVAKEIFEVLPEAVAVIDFLCSKLHEQEASDEPVFEKIKEEAIITEEEPTTKLAGLGWVQKSTDQQAVASELCQEEDDEPEITILEVRGQESSTALPTKEPIIVDPEIASLLEEMLTDVMFFHDLHLVVDYLVNRVEMEHEQEEEGFVGLSSQNAGNVTVSTKVPAGSCRAEESRNDMTLIAGMLHRLAGDVAEQIAKEDEEEELTMKALDFSWLEKEALDTFADEIAENAIMYAAEDVSQKRMEEISDFQGTTEEQSDQPTAAVASSAAELPMPPITEEPQMPPSTSHFYDDIENDMGDLSVPLFSAPTANVSSIIESTKSLHREADSERPLGIPFEEEDDFFNFKEPENLVEVQSSAVVLEENNDETKSFVGTHFLEADVEDQAIRNRTFSEVSSISEEAASRRNHPALRSETPEAILTSREPSPAVEETFAKTIPPVAESTVDESLSFEELTVSQPDCQDEDIQRLLNGDGPGAPPPSQALNTIDSFMNDDESATVPVPAVQLPAVRNTYDKQETMLHGQLPRYHEQNNIGMGPYQLQNNITRVHHNYSQPISTGWSTTPFASAQQPPIQQGYPQQMQNTYYHPPQYPHMNTPWGMNALGTNSFMVRSHHPNLTTQHAWSDYQQPGQAFPPINAVYPNPVQPQQMMNHNMPGVQSFNGGYFRGPLQQQISYNYTQPQHQQQPMPPMAYHQGQGPYPVHQNQMANQEIRRQLEQRQMRTQRPVPQHLRHEPREVVVNIYRPVPEDTVNVANYYRSPSSHYSQYPPGLPQTASVQQYPPQALPRSQTNQVHITPRDQLPSTPASDRINQELAIYMANDLHESRQRLAQAPPNVAFTSTSTSSVSTSNSTSSSIPNPEVASMFAETKQLIYIKEKIYGDSNEKANVDVSELYANKVPPFPRREKAKRLKNVPQHYDRLPEPFEQKDIIVNSGELDPVTDASVYKSVNRAVLTLIKTHRQSKKQKEKNLFMSEIWTTHLAHHVLTHIQSALPNVQSTVTTVHYEMTTSKLRLALKAALDQLEDGEIVDSNSLDCISREPSNARNAKFLENFLASICATPIDKSESNSVNFVTAEPSKFYDENPDCREIRSLRDYLQLFLNTVPGEGNEQGSAEVGSARCVFMVFKNNDSKGNVIGCHNFVMSYGALLKGAAAAQNIKVGPFRPYRTDASRLPNNQNIYRLGHGGVDSTVELDTTHEGCSLLYYSGLYDRTDPKQYATFLCCSMEFMPIDSHKELLKELGLTLIGVARTPEKQSASDEDLRRIARENPTKKFISPDTVKLDLAIPCFTEKMCLVYHQRITLDKYDLGFKDYAQAVDTILANIASHFDSNDAQARIKHDIMRPFAFAQMYCENIYKNLICYGISNAFLTASCSPSNSISRSPKTYREKCKDICLGTQRILGKIFSLFTKGQAESCFNEIQTLVENNAQMSDEEKKIVVSERAFYHISKLNITDVLLGMDRPLKSSTDLRNQYERSRDLGKLQPAWNHHERDFERERIVDFELNDKDFDQRNNYDHELWNANTPEERKLAMINITAKVLSKETSVSFDMVKHGILAEWKDDIKLSNTPSNEEIERILRPLNAQTRAAVQSLFLWERIHSYMDTSVTESRWTIEGLNKLFPRLAPVGTKAQAIKEQLILNPERGNFRIKIRQLKQLESPTMEPLEGAKVNKKQEKRNDGNDDQSKRIGAKRKDRDDSQNGPPTKSHNGPKSYNQYNQNGVNFAVPSLPYFTEADLCSSGVRNYAESTVSIDSGFDSLPSIDTPAKAKLLGNDKMTTLQAAIDIWETASIRSIESSVSLPIVEEGPAAEKDITDTAVIARREKRRLSLDSAQNSDTEAPLDYIPSSKKTNTMSEVPPVEVLRLDTTAPQKSSTKSDTPQILSPCSVSSSDSGSRDGKKRGQSYLLFNSLYGVLTEDVNNSSQSSRCTSEEIDIVGRKKESPRLEQDTRFIVPSPSLVAKRLSPLVSKRSSQSQEPTALPVEKVRRVEQVQDFHQDTVPNVKEEVHFYYKKRYVIQKDFNAKTATIIVSKRKARGKRSEMQPSAKAEIINRLFNEGKTVLPLIFDGNSLALVTMEELWDKTNLSSSSGLQRRVRKTCSSESVSRIESANFRRLSETLKRPLPVTEFLVAKRARQSATLPEPLTIPNSSRPLIITKAALKELPSRTRERYLARSLSHEENHEHQAGTKSPLRSPLTDSDSDVDKGLVIDTGSDDEGVVSEDEQEPFVIYDAPSPVASPSPVDSPTHVQLKEVSKRLLIDIPFSTPPRLPKLCTKAKSAGHSPIGYLFAEKMSLRHCFTQFRKQGRLTGLTERLKESAPDHCANGKLLRKFLFVAEKELHRHKASDHCDVLLRKPSVFRKRSQSTDRFFPRPLKEHFAEVWEIAQDSLYLEEQSSPLLSPAVGHNYSRPSNSSSVLCSPASKSNYRSLLAQDVRFPGYEQLLNSFMPKSPDGLLYFRSLDLEHVYFPFTHSALLSQQFMKPF